jgi:hypothetical protein
MAGAQVAAIRNSRQRIPGFQFGQSISDAPLAKQTRLDTKLVTIDNKTAKGLQLLCPKYIYPN